VTTPPLFCIDPSNYLLAAELSQRFDLSLTEQLPAQGLYLRLDDTGLELKLADEPALGGVRVDFVDGRAQHRRKFGGAEAVTKALGIKKGHRPRVLDATAGLGRDAFVVAGLGCDVTMVERSPAVAALLDDGLRRARLDLEIGDWVNERLHLIYASSLSDLPKMAAEFDAVYLDPMYPHRKKSAQVKKEMRLFQLLVGSDADADALLPAARATGAKRIVVKRPTYADYLNGEKPQADLKTKSHRFDIYLS
jgi:16S rRNA (guanine1516-N2)-methyltransferase